MTNISLQYVYNMFNYILNSSVYMLCESISSLFPSSLLFQRAREAPALLAEPFASPLSVFEEPL